jgi:hypothetical protein
MPRIVDRISFAVIGALLLALVAVLAGIAGAGPLDPALPPGSTMKTLDEIPGSWSRNPSAVGGCDSPRFDCVLGSDAAVLDLVTGLVWERSPNNTVLFDPFAGQNHCAEKIVGGVKGWRVPSIEQLASLVQVGNSNPALPTGHPFLTVLNENYWSSSVASQATSNDNYRFVSVGTGLVFYAARSEAMRVWCVRGGAGFDGVR